MRVAYNKLVRDQIPDIIAATGSQPSTRVLDHASYQVALRSKLLEEAQEAEAAADEQLASELAPTMTFHSPRRGRHRARNSESARFDRRIFLEHVDQAP